MANGLLVLPDIFMYHGVEKSSYIAEYVKGGMQIRMLTVSFVYMFLR